MSQLPNAAIRVVKASRTLESVDKLVWTEIFYLDKGPDGCFISPKLLAARVGRSQASLEKSRRRLVKSGLLRRSSKRVGWGRGVRWFVHLYAEYIPSDRPTDEQVSALAKKLDESLSIDDSKVTNGLDVAAIVAPLTAALDASNGNSTGTINQGFAGTSTDGSKGVIAKESTEGEQDEYSGREDRTLQRSDQRQQTAQLDTGDHLCTDASRSGSRRRLSLVRMYEDELARQERGRLGESADVECNEIRSE